MLTPQNARHMLFTTSYPPDKLIGPPLTGSFTATASSSPFLAHRTHHAINHGFGVPVFLQMAYSRDGGTSWQDQHVSVPDLTVPSAPIFQTLEVGCYATTSQTVIVASNWTTGAISVQFVAAQIWNDRSSQAVTVNPPSGGGSDDTGFIFTTKHSIPKIYLDDTETVEVPVSGAPPAIYSTVLTVDHDLGYIPNARVWYEPVSGELWPLSPNQYSNTDGGPGTTLDVFGRFYLTTTQLVVELANLGGSPVDVPIHTRIYCDE